MNRQDLDLDVTIRWGISSNRIGCGGDGAWVGLKQGQRGWDVAEIVSQGPWMGLRQAQRGWDVADIISQARVAITYLISHSPVNFYFFLAMA